MFDKKVIITILVFQYVVRISNSVLKISCVQELPNSH